MKKIILTLSLILAICYVNGQTTWVTKFNYNIQSGGENQSGAETNGTYFFTTHWNSDTIVKYDMTGNLVEKFTITGVSNIRDLAYDGYYFYGGSVDSFIYKMDFTSKVLVGKIHCPSGTKVRSLAYDGNNDAFWVGNWATDLQLISRQGQIITSIPAANHKLLNMFGSAYDSVTPGGPYLWVFNQGGNYCDIIQIRISVKMPTGLIHDATKDVAANSTGAKAGGLFIYKEQSGASVLAGIYQGSPVGLFGYALSSVYISKDLAMVSLLSPETSCGLTSNEKIKIRVQNLGYDTVTNLPVAFQIDTILYSNYIFGKINPYQTVDYEFPIGVFMASIKTYQVKVYSSLSGDVNRVNDTITKNISNLTANSIPYTMGFNPGEDYSGWKKEDANTDSYSWDYSQTGGYNNSPCYVYSWNPNGITQAEDWLFSTCLLLDTGKTYAVKFLTKVALSTYPERLKLYIGDKAFSGWMTYEIRDLQWMTNDSFVVVFNEFTVPYSGTFYLGFLAYSAADNFKLFLDEIVIDQNVGIEEKTSVTEIKIYPVPASSQLTIQANTLVSGYMVYNSVGQNLISEKSNAKGFNIDISSLSPGVYFLKLITNQGLINKKFVVE